jgi:hypothetical protein
MAAIHNRRCAEMMRAEMHQGVYGRRRCKGEKIGCLRKVGGKRSVNQEGGQVTEREGEQGRTCPYLGERLELSVVSRVGKVHQRDEADGLVRSRDLVGRHRCLELKLVVAHTLQPG